MFILYNICNMKNILLNIISTWTSIGIFLSIIILSMVLSFFIYFLIRSIMVEKAIEKYNDKISQLLDLPFNNKLKKLESLKEKNARYEEDYKEIQKSYSDFTNIHLETFSNRIKDVKYEIKGFHIKYPQEQLDSLNKQFVQLTKTALRIINKLDSLTYPDQLQLQIFRNIQDHFNFFKNSYLSHRGTLKHFNKMLDKWLEEIKLKFKEYNKGESNVTQQLNIAKESLNKIILDIQEFAEVVELLLMGSTILSTVIDPSIKTIKKMSMKHVNIIEKNVEEFYKDSKKYKESMKKFINTKKTEHKIIIQRRIEKMIKDFKKFEIKFIRQIKSQDIVKEIVKPINNHFNDMNKKHNELIGLSIRVKKNELNELNDLLNKNKEKQNELSVIHNAIIRLQKRSKENSFEVATQILVGSVKYFETAEEYQQMFYESLKFISSNLESYSRFEEHMNDLNTILIKIESNINEHDLKLEKSYKEVFNLEKEKFNILIEERNQNKLIYDRDTESELIDNINVMEDFLSYVERLNRISLIVEISLLLLNKQKGEDVNLDTHIDRVENEYNDGKYSEALNSLIKIIQIYDVKG